MAARSQRGGGRPRRGAEMRDRGPGAPRFLGDDGRLTIRPPGAAVALRNEQAGATQIGRQSPPQPRVVSLGGLGPGQHLAPAPPVLEHRAAGTPQLGPALPLRPARPPAPPPPPPPSRPPTRPAPPPATPL